MSKTYYSLGLMSGTSGDGVDASVIKSNGKDDYNVISDNYFKYTNEIYENIHNLREKINKPQDLKTHSKELENLEKEITLYHVDVVKKVVKNTSENIDLIGLHGQTIFHNGNKKISKQLGDGKLLSSSTKKIVVYDFRQNDMKNGGNGAPLAPIFHKQLVLQIGFDLPITIFNLGGLANATHLWTNPFSSEKLVSSANDIGPGNCLIDLWIRKNSNYKFDIEGNIAKSGKIDKIILDNKNKAKNYYNDARKKVLMDINKKRGTLENEIGEEIKIAEKEILELKKNAPDKINKIAIETSTDLVKQLIGVEVNNSSISAIVEDLSKKNKDKYYGV